MENFGTMLRRWAWLIALCALLGAFVAFAISWLALSVYEATVTLRINPAGPSEASTSTPQGLRQTDTYAEMVCTRAVLAEVIANLALDTTIEDLQPFTGAASIPDTLLIAVTVRDPDPGQAIAIANEIAAVFVEQQAALASTPYAEAEAALETEMASIQLAVYQVQEDLAALGNSTSRSEIAERERLEALLAGYQSSYADLLASLNQIRQTETAAAGTVSIAMAAGEARPISPDAWLNMLLGAIPAGLCGAAVALWLEYHKGTTPDGKAEVETLTGAPTLGVIDRIQAKDPLDVLVTTVRPRSPIAEAYRVLRSNIAAAGNDQPIKVILVTSADRFEGKTTTAANLAIAASQAGLRTIIVDGHLRRPILHKLFQQDNTTGLSVALTGSTAGRASDYLVSTGLPNLLLFPSGPTPPNPITLLESERLKGLVDDLRVRADVIFVDSSPLLPSPILDAAFLARRCDAALLVVSSASARSSQLVKAKERLNQAGARLLGVVLNAAPG